MKARPQNGDLEGAGSTIHYSGRMFSAKPDLEHSLAGAIDKFISQFEPTYGFGSLACGADILVVERLQDANLPVHVVLPSPIDRFLKTSVENGGAGWLERFDRCLARAMEVAIVGGNAVAGNPQSFNFASEVAMGLAVLTARDEQTEAVQLLIKDKLDRSGQAGADADMALWKSAGRRVVIIDLPKMPSLSAARSDLKIPSYDCSVWFPVVLSKDDTLRLRKPNMRLSNPAPGLGTCQEFRDPEGAIDFAVQITGTTDLENGLLLHADFTPNNEDERCDWRNKQLTDIGEFANFTPKGAILATASFAGLVAHRGGAQFEVKDRISFAGQTYFRLGFNAQEGTTNSHPTGTATPP